MDADIVIQHLDVRKPRHGEVERLLLFPQPQELLPLSQGVHGLEQIALQHIAQVAFQNVAQCLHLIACRGVIDVVRHKEDQRAAIILPKGAGDVNAALRRVLKVDIQKGHVTGGKRLRRKLSGATEGLDIGFYMHL